MMLLAFVMTYTTVNIAQADWAEFWHRVKVDWHRMNAWPEPFQIADREVTMSPLLAMSNAGWRIQNTLSDHFFDVETQELTQAGQLKLRWIATQTPLHRRTIHVLRSYESGATNLRVQSVERYLDKFVLGGARPDVILTSKVPAGGSGEYFENIDRQLKASVPSPRLAPTGGPIGG
jgi:hypothetical protein